jgi:DNA helicase-2/ATP-dependent DNA helicase PcrA
MWRAAASLIAAEQLQTRAARALWAFLKLIDDLDRETSQAELHEQVRRVIDSSGLIPHYSKDPTGNAEARIENLEELVSAARDALGMQDEELPPLVAFLSYAALESGEAQAGAHEDGVQLMTLHSAKGLEFPLLFLCGLEDGLFPHQRSINDADGLEEERRLCYVGMTRAMERLTITSAAERLRFGSRTYGVPSRFLAEIPAEVVEQGVGGRADGRGRGGRSAPPGRGAHYDYSYSQEEPGEAGGIARGMRVRHPHFGEGLVVTVAGSGPSTKLKIQFDRAGVKTLLLRFANLEPA